MIFSTAFLHQTLAMIEKSSKTSKHNPGMSHTKAANVDLFIYKYL
jgi:hypothetical protein